MRASTTKRGKRPSKSATQSARKSATASLDDEVQAVLARLKRHGTRATRDGLARYAIPSDKAFDVSVGTMRQEAKRLGHNHDLAAALWETGWYEARMMATFLESSRAPR